MLLLHLYCILNFIVRMELVKQGFIVRLLELLVDSIKELQLEHFIIEVVKIVAMVRLVDLLSKAGVTFITS